MLPMIQLLNLFFLFTLLTVFFYCKVATKCVCYTVGMYLLTSKIVVNGSGEIYKQEELDLLNSPRQLHLTIPLTLSRAVPFLVRIIIPSFV